MAFKPVQTRIQKLFGGQAILREAVSKMASVCFFSKLVKLLTIGADLVGSLRFSKD